MLVVLKIHNTPPLLSKMYASAVPSLKILNRRWCFQFTAKPHWLQTITDTALSIEENLFWECKANGKPKPSYSWLKNGEALASEVRKCCESLASDTQHTTLDTDQSVKASW